MLKVENFLSAKEEKEIVKAIRQAEQNTSGEIRVHIEKTAKISHYLRVQEVFENLKMYKTSERNGVLFYVAVDDRKFVVYGDEGINKVVPANFWNITKQKTKANWKLFCDRVVKHFDAQKVYNKNKLCQKILN